MLGTGRGQRGLIECRLFSTGSYFKAMAHSLILKSVSWYGLSHEDQNLCPQLVAKDPEEAITHVRFLGMQGPPSSDVSVPSDTHFPRPSSLDSRGDYRTGGPSMLNYVNGC